MNHLEYGFYDELEKIAAANKATAALLAAAVLGGPILSSINTSVNPPVDKRVALEDFGAKNSKGARTGYGHVKKDTARAALTNPIAVPEGAPRFKVPPTMDRLRAAMTVDRAASDAPTSPGQYGWYGGR